MPGRSHDHLIQEPRIRRVVRRPVTPVPAPRREETPAPSVPAPRTPSRREGHRDPTSPGGSGI